MPYLLLTKPSSLIKDWYLIRSYNQSGVCSVELLLARLMEALSPLHGYSAVANQLIDLEDWGGAFVMGVGHFFWGGGKS